MTKQNRHLPQSSIDRRHFIKNSAALVGSTVLGSALSVHAGSWNRLNDPIKIALIGCGSRGAGAAVNALSTKENVVLVAMADIFKDKLDETYNTLLKIDTIKNAVNVPEKNRFVGFDAYKQAMALADVVLLVTPAAFRPQHFEAAVNSGKHVFMEKPLACDAPGIRKILATGELATTKNLKVVVGLQNRYDPGYIEMVDKLKSGAIGNIISATDYYLVGPIKNVPWQGQQSEMEYQLRNWRYFNWLWAGSPAGLQIHNTDVVNWVKNSYPIRAQGLGGRSSLHGRNHGDIFDHFFIEYEYADGTKLNSQIRHVNGTWNKGGSVFLGTNGTASLQSGIKNAAGERIWKNSNTDSESAYQIEHDKLFAAIRNNTPINDTEWAAKSTMTTILGRMAVHSGRMIQWDEAFNSQLSLFPEKLAWDATPPVTPDKDGNYPIPSPGQSQEI